MTARADVRATLARPRSAPAGLVLLRAAAWATARLPWGALGALGSALGHLAGSVLRIRRRAVELALARAGVPAPRTEARAMYAGLGRGVFELLWLAGASPERRRRAITDAVGFAPGALEALDAALARGPVVLAASHTASWELSAYAAALALAARSKRLAAVVKPISSPTFERFCDALREACGLDRIGPAGALARSRSRLGEGDVVALPIDQVPERARHGEMLPFLGAPAFVDRAPATLAFRAAATLLVVGSRRAGGRQEVHVLASLPPPGPGDVAGAWIRDTSRAATGALEAFVRARPRDWLWLHRRWREPRARRLVASGVRG